MASSSIYSPSAQPPLSNLNSNGVSSPNMNWRDILTAKNFTFRDFPLSFVPTVDEKVSFTEEEMQEGARDWDLALIGYLLDKRPYYEALLTVIKKTWSLKGTKQMFSLNNFLYKFSHPEDLEIVWHGDPWFFFGFYYLEMECEF